MQKKAIVNLLKTLLPLALGIYLIWYFFSNMSEDQLSVFYKSLKEANYFWIFVSLLLSFCAFCIRAYRWKYALEPLGYTTRFWHRYHALMIGYIVNLTIPRAGEASRSAMLYRSDGVPFSKSFGTIIGERAVDLIMLSAVAVLTALIGYEDFISIFHQIKTKFSPAGEDEKSLLGTIFFILIILIAIGGVSVVVFIEKWRSKMIRFSKDILAGLLSVFKSRNPGAYLFQTILIWVLYVVYFAIPFLSLEATSDFPLDGILLAFIAGSLGITFTNGGIGTFPLLVALVYVFYRGSSDPDAQAIGNALGMIIWVSQTLLLIVMGLVSLVLLPKNYTEENEPSEIPSK